MYKPDRLVRLSCTNDPPVGHQAMQLNVFSEITLLARVRPERNEFRFYCMEVWPDFFGRALLMRLWGLSARTAVAGSIRIQTPEQPRTRSPSSSGRISVGATRPASAVRPF